MPPSNPVASAMQSVEGPHGQEAADVLQSLTGGVKEGLGMAGGAIGEAMGGPVGGALGEMLGKALPDLMMAPMKAAMALKDAFDSLVTTVRPFVEAFAPSQILVFDQAIYDVSAVIGSMLVPVMTALTATVRAFGEMLLPVTRVLEPAITQLSEAFMKLLIPMTRTLSGAFQAIASVAADVTASFVQMMPLFEGLLELWRAFSAVVVALHVQLWQGIKALGAATDSFMHIRGVLDLLADSFKTLARKGMIAAAVLAKLTGSDEFMKSLRKSLGEGVVTGSTVGFGAAKDARIEKAPDWVMRLATAASVASGKVGQSEEDKWRKDVLEDLEKIDAHFALLQSPLDRMAAAFGGGNQAEGPPTVRQGAGGAAGLLGNPSFAAAEVIRYLYRAMQNQARPGDWD